MAHWQCGTSLAFVTHQALTRVASHHHQHDPCSKSPLHATSRYSTLLHSRREPDDDFLSTTVDKVGALLSKPTPGFPSLPIVYPVALVSAAIILPPITAILLTLFFVGYSYLANEIVQDKEEGGIISFAALVAAIPSAGLLSPSGFQNVNTQGISILIGVAIVGLVLATVSEALPTKDEKLLDEWDDKFDKDYKD